MKNGVTIEEARRLWDYNPDTGRFVWLVRPKGSRVHAGDRAGTVVKFGYRMIRYNRVKYHEHWLAWFFTHGVWPRLLDHINGDRGDNRIANLREATASQNHVNAVFRNSTGFKGVTKKYRKWHAYIHINRKRKYLGAFDSAEAAHEVHVRAHVAMYGEFSRIGQVARANGWFCPQD